MATMLKLLLLFLTLCSLHPQCLTGASQEEELSSRENPLLEDSYLGDVSGSVLKAEAWLRAHVLSQYPASGATTIVVGETVFCAREQLEPKLSLVLLSLKNMHRSLKRWGLEEDIKLSVSLSESCFPSQGSVYSMGSVRPVLKFLQSVNSTFILDSSPTKSSPLWEMSSKFRSLGYLDGAWSGKTMARKLSTSEIGFFVPAHKAKSPHPPPSGSRLPFPPHTLPTLPPQTFPFAPEQPPVSVPAMAPFAFTLPPCSQSPPPAGAGAAPPSGATETGRQRLWCVAKPTVPDENLQEAMDYACGEGGGSCGEIMPSGSCYYPNTVIAHASYAFNSYWQKNKRNGGTCSFGGTAMLINADPSFLHCKFELS
ncbi:hypothetical protein SAY87_023964 [Trapa incisa]|uniref:X8 domain-containing protein n=1 Tax=Trapa incisa TaxID=236973 RepID=A0AAN7L4C5_9MYRT|nr:hypothetical protein SAY87_023964 [Trapa incisa]